MNEMKMMKTAAKLDAFFKVLQKVVAIGIGVMVIVIAVLTVVNAVNPDAVIGEDFHMIDLGPVTLELAEEQTPDNTAVLGYAWFVVAFGIAAAVVICWALGCLRKILAPMKEGRPFDASVSCNIKKIGYAVLAWGVISNVGKAVETSMALRYFNIDALSAVGEIRSVTVSYTFDISFVIVFFLLLLVSYIFRYGAELQQLSDETL